MLVVLYIFLTYCATLRNLSYGIFSLAHYSHRPFLGNILCYKLVTCAEVVFEQVIEQSSSSTAECWCGSVTGQHLSAD